MGIQMIAASLAIMGVLMGSALGSTTFVTANTAQHLTKAECVYACDCVQDMIRLQEYTGNQTQDRINIADCAQDQLKIQDQLHSCDGNLDQMRTLLARLTGDLRDLSLAESGRLKLELVPVNIVELIRREASQFEVKANNKGLHIKLDVPEVLLFRKS